MANLLIWAGLWPATEAIMEACARPNAMARPIPGRRLFNFSKRFGFSRIGLAIRASSLLHPDLAVSSRGFRSRAAGRHVSWIRRPASLRNGLGCGAFVKLHIAKSYRELFALHDKPTATLRQRAVATTVAAAELLDPLRIWENTAPVQWGRILWRLAGIIAVVFWSHCSRIVIQVFRKADVFLQLALLTRHRCGLCGCSRQSDQDEDNGRGAHGQRVKPVPLECQDSRSTVGQAGRRSLVQRAACDGRRSCCAEKRTA